MRKIFFITTLLLSLSSSMAQTSIKDILKTIPQEILPYVNDDQRKEINEFVSQKDTIEIKNALNGTTRIHTSGDNFAQFDLNETTKLQIKLLPVNDSTKIICIAKTVMRPISDSSISFFSTDWAPIHSNFNLPIDNSTETLLSMFTQRPDTMTTARYNELIKCIEPVIISANISNNDYTITFSLDVPFVQKSEIDTYKAITRQKTFKWDGRSFKIC